MALDQVLCLVFIFCTLASVGLAQAQCEAFVPNRIILREDTMLLAEIGPAANPRGYTGITGRPAAGFDISWYSDGNLVPELVVERNRIYNFIVYGGNNPADNANYNPLYITSSENGGRLLKRPDQRMDELVFAGFDDNDQVTMTSVGALCEYRETATSERIRQTCGPYENYINSLEPFCFNMSQPGMLIWTPDENTPDLVYYQSASNVNLGHAIQVINQNDPAPPRILHPSSPTVPVVTPTTMMLTDSMVVMPVQTDNGTPSSLKLSGFIGWITILVLTLFATLTF